MSTTLALFWDLSSASKGDRIAASVKLVSALQHFQSQHTPKPDAEDDEQVNSLDRLNAQDVSYSIRRLARGLASPRDSSRLGFSVALTELLSGIDTVTCSQIYSLILDSTKSQGSMTGQEERDMLFAQLFGIMAIVQSGLLVRTKPLPASASSDILPSSLNSYQEIVAKLMALGEKKSWLRESCWWTLGLAVESVHGSDVLWRDEAVEWTIENIVSQSWSPEKVALVIKLRQLYPNRDWQSHASPVFKNADILSTTNMPVLARILKDSSIEEDTQDSVAKPAPGSWKPQLHFVWDVILDVLLPTGGNETPANPFPEFFRIVVDESLFSSNASQERKFWGFQIFQKALTRMTESTMPMLFTKNFMRTWINHLSKDDRYLHKIAIQTVNEVQGFAQKNPHLGFSLILQLTGAHGSQQFDKLTKTKTVENILPSMDQTGIESYLHFVLRQSNEFEGIDQSDFKAINARRSWVIDQLYVLVKNPSVPKKDEWVQTVVEWLLCNGLFQIKRKSSKSKHRVLHTVPKPPFSEELQETCRTRLLNVIADLTNQAASKESGKFSFALSAQNQLKLLLVDDSSESWLSKVLKMIDTFDKDTDHLTPLIEVDETLQDLFSKAVDSRNKLSEVPQERKEEAMGVTLLTDALLLNLRCSAEPKPSDLQALEACLEAASRMFAKKSKKARKSTTADDNEHLPIDVLVDVIIGLLEQSTTFMRTIANSAFSFLVTSLQSSAVELVLAQLQRRDPSELQEGESDDDMEDVEEEASDSSSSSESADDDSEEEELSDAQVDEELKEKIAQALGVNGINDDAEDSDEELMDDDQMMAIDEKLAEVFRSQRNDKRANKVNAQREATHFKNRVLDLVDILFKKQPSNPLVLRLILPLVDLATTSGPDEKHLSDKAQGILKSRIAKFKTQPADADLVEAKTLLTDLHKRASRAGSSSTLSLLSLCSLYLTKLLPSPQESAIEVYRESFKDFMTRKASGFNATFFQDLVKRLPTTAWALRDDFLALSKDAVNTYRRCQAFQIVQTLVFQVTAAPDAPDVDEVAQFMKSLQTALLNLIQKAVSEGVLLSAAQVKSLLKLSLQVIRRYPNSTDSQSWQNLGNQLNNSERFKASRTLCTQVADQATGKAKSLKRPLESSGRDEEKRKKSKQKTS